MTTLFNPMSHKNIVKQFVDSMFKPGSLMHYSMNNPLPEISVKELKRILGVLLVTMAIQIKYSKDAKAIIRVFSRKTLFIGNLAGIGVLGLAVIIKYVFDRERER